MIDEELSEIDSWLVLPFADFAINVVFELISRFVGINGHTGLLTITLLREDIGDIEIPRYIGTVADNATNCLKEIQITMRSLAFYDHNQQSDFLKMLIKEITPFVDDIDQLIVKIPPSDVRQIVSIVWNIRENNLVRLRRLLRVCRSYSANHYP